MSHVDSGFAIKDIEALASVVRDNCPELQMVQQKTYRTWLTDNGRLVGDTALPAIYQLRLLSDLITADVDVHAIAEKQGVTLPSRLLDLEQSPWSLRDQKKLFDSETFQKAYERLQKNVIGQDAEYVIKFREGCNRTNAYEIGCVPDPVRHGEYLLMTDYYHQGNGLLLAKGVGKADSEGKWGAELKAAYSVVATERHIEQGIASRQYASYTKQTLPNGTVQFKVETAN